jgi:serine/threonine protein kinase
MEYIAGGTLKEWLVGNAVPWQKSAQLLACVARALEAAHAQGIIHRDVKPANILMANGRDPMLSDFGIAKLIEDSALTSDLTGTGVGIGTPDYMAPEQGVGIVDERSDIYSLGVIFYQMVTSRLPYEADTPLAVIIKKTTEPLPRPTQYVPGLPAVVENTITRALARDPQYRYRNMGEFALVLERLGSMADTLETVATNVQSSMPAVTTADPATHSGTVITKAVKSPLSWAVSAGVLVVCCAALVLGGLLWRMMSAGPDFLSVRSEATGTPAIVPSSAASIPPTVRPNSAAPAPRPTRTAAPRSTPTVEGGGGRWIAFNSRMGGNADIYVVDPRGRNLTRLTSSSAHDLYASWSPDGKKIVYQNDMDGDHEINIMEVTTDRVTRLTTNDCNDWGPVWSPDGEWIVFYSDCDGERDIFKVRTDGSGRMQLTSTSGSYNWFPSWSPDGREITFSSNRSGKYHIHVMEDFLSLAILLEETPVRGPLWE